MNLKQSMLRVVDMVLGRKQTRKRSSRSMYTLEQYTAKALLGAMYTPIQYISDDTKLKARIYYAMQHGKVLNHEDSVYVIAYYVQKSQLINSIINNHAVQKINPRKR